MSALRRRSGPMFVAPALCLVLAVTGCRITIDNSGRGPAPNPPPAEPFVQRQAVQPDPDVRPAGYQASANNYGSPGGNAVPLPAGVVGGNQSGGVVMNNGPGMVMTDPSGCGPMMSGPVVSTRGKPSTELAFKSHPPYVIEPPDVLLISPIRMIPKPPYTVGPFDVLLIRLAKGKQDQPIDGTFTISPDGTINLGYSYGVVRVGGLTLEEVERAIRRQLSEQAGIKEPQVAVGLAQYRGAQQARGEHLVRQDGTIDLGSYGCVHVAGLTLLQAKVAIERHLSHHLLEPEVSVDVLAYNSKVYYVIFDGAGYGQNVYRFPITGKETVLDAVAQLQGLPPVSSTRHIWVARPAPPDHPCMQILPVDWLAITMGGTTTTNWQLFPGDRVYVQSDPLIRTDNFLAKLFAPVERVLGIALLGGATRQAFQSNGGNGAAFIAPIR